MKKPKPNFESYMMKILLSKDIPELIESERYWTEQMESSSELMAQKAFESRKLVRVALDKVLFG